MKKNCLTDTGFWIGIIDPSDSKRENSLLIYDLIENHNILFPWPCVYETLKTRYSRRRDSLIILEKILKLPQITFISDIDYREDALEKTFLNFRLNKPTHSLADNVIREILHDINIKVDYLITFNKRDFIDVCHKRNIEILE